jgi:hypothetical protein
MSVLYRARQFGRAVQASVTAADREVAVQHLAPGELAIFDAMPVALQRHHLNVFHDLVAAGCADHDVLVAALIHDAGKGDTNVWARVAYVVLDPVPGAVDRLAPRDGAGFRAMLHRHRHHPRLGADAARAAGASERVVWLIEHQEDDVATAPEPYRLALRQLQAADNRN